MVYRKAWAVQYQRDRARGQTRYVDAEPTRSRLAELTAAHVPVRALGRACGLSDTGVKAILAGTRTQVQQETATRVARICLRDIYSDQATGHVPKIGAVRRVHALMAMGWSHHQLEAAGVPNTARLLSGLGHLVTVERWREVCEVYDRLSMTPGPSPETRGWARARGYAPPLAWDEDSIDDPTARPDGELSKGRGADVIDMVAVRRTLDGDPRGPDLTAREKTLAVGVLAARGTSDPQIADRLGVSDRTVLRWRQREGIPTRHAGALAPDLQWQAAVGATRLRSTRGASPSFSPATGLSRPLAR